MAKENGEEISIITTEIKGTKEALEMFPSTSRIVAKTGRLATGRLAKNMTVFLQMLENVVKDLPSQCGDYNVDTLSFSLSVDASGKVSLVGELAAGVTAGITVTLKR